MLKLKKALSAHSYLPFKTNHKVENKRNKSVYKEVPDSTEIALKYSGYAEREIFNAKKLKNLESLLIPEKFDYTKIKSLSTEAMMKLMKHRPRNIAQASRIPGLSPADISVLLIYFGRQAALKEKDGQEANVLRGTLFHAEIKKGIIGTFIFVLYNKS